MKSFRDSKVLSSPNPRFFSDIFIPNVKRGFLPSEDPLMEMPQYSDLTKRLNRIAKNLPDLLKQKTLRITIDALNKEFFDSEKILLFDKVKEKNIAMVILTMLTQAYIFEEGKQSANCIPEILGLNLKHICKSERRFPIISYRDYILNNWYRKDTQKEITLDNIEPIFTLTGTEDEKWFIKIHVVIEATCAPAIRAIYDACLLSCRMNDDTSMQHPQNEEALTDLLKEDIVQSLNEANKIMVQMKEHLNPKFFYHTLRPYLAGWNGVKFAGESASHQYKGPSGAQSSILPALDEALGIRHEVDGMFQHLLTFIQYMPLEHQYFINLIKLRSIELNPTCSKQLSNALNSAIEEVRRFRYFHRYAMVDRFIFKPAQEQGVNPNEITGTGGSPLSNYLENRHSDSILGRPRL